jgi:Smg protein
MSDRLSDLLSALRDRFAADADVAEVEAYLSSEGFDRRQIGEILTRLFPHRMAAPPGPPTIESSMTFRVLGPHEWGRFAPEAWGHLLSLSGSGALSGPELEQVIERAMVQFEGRIALEDLRALIDTSGFEESGPGGLDQVNVH